MWKESVTIGSRTIELETGKIGQQAHGAVMLRQGNTVILSTVVYNPSYAGRGDFLPLTVDYREYMAAGGRIPGGFLRREGRGNDAEILASRLCDRSLRPLFPKGFYGETQVSSTVHSYDPATDPRILSIIGAAAALHLSEIPWGGPLAAIRVGRIGGEFVAFPSPEELRGSDLDLAISFSSEGVVMIEGGSRELAEADMLAAFSFAQAQVAPLLQAMDSLRAQAGREKAPLPEPPEPPPFAAELESKATPLLREALSIPEKPARRAAVRQIGQRLSEELGETASEGGAEPVEALLENLEARLMREGILAENRRVDGREPGAIRPIACEVDWLPSVHGSALFTRGETQATVTVTLGTTQDRMLVESLEGVRYERFLLHYNFPPYSVGEAVHQGWDRNSSVIFVQNLLYRRKDGTPFVAGHGNRQPRREALQHLPFIGSGMGYKQSLEQERHSTSVQRIGKLSAINRKLGVRTTQQSLRQRIHPGICHRASYKLVQLQRSLFCE